ncbi:MAG TPA: response regulator [Candidatus Eisenbacteria bacterium]|nr:response regulator [Candidatus Eisenbacteria bacterium]
MRVLVVDDDPDNVLILSIALRREGYEVVSTTNGLEALDLAKKAAPDLVILDILMPGHDGIEVGMLLKNDIATSQIPIIFLTALKSPHDRDDVLSVGPSANTVIGKPIDSRELFGAIRQVIRRAA